MSVFFFNRLIVTTIVLKTPKTIKGEFWIDIKNLWNTNLQWLGMWPSVSYETYFLLLCDIGNPYYLEHLPNLSMYCQSTYMHNFFNFLGIVVKK